MESKKKKKQYNEVQYFIMLPFEDENFKEEYIKLTERLKTENPEGFDEGLLQKPTKLHMTVIVLDLDNQSQVDAVSDILDSIHEEMKEMAGSELNFNFESFESMRNPESTNVVYGKMLEDENHFKLDKIIDLIIRRLVECGVIFEKNLGKMSVEKKNGKYKVRLHLTLLNVTFLNKILRKNKKPILGSFNAKEILYSMSGLSLPSCPLKKVDFCVMREDKATERYEVIKSFSLQ